ncbi:MAG: lasso peptide biosynthesis B2 protein [Sphingomicrobium sp.]
MLRWRLLVVEAAAALAFASAALALMPFRRAIRTGSLPLSSVPTEKRVSPVEAAAAVRRATSLVPWRAVCIDQGLALQRLLRKRDVDAQLHYGVALADDTELKAHVWVEVEGAIVIGGEEAAKYARVASFP